MRPKADQDGLVRYKLKKLPGLPPDDQIFVIRHKRLTEVVLNRSRPSEKQIELALGLLRSRGYGVNNQTTEDFDDFGLDTEIGINIECWLASLSIPKIRMLIDDLLQRPMEFNLFNPKQ